jgi:hypothetical protein
LSVDNHDPRLRVHFSECVSGAQAGDTGTDNQPIGFLRAFESIASG